MILFLLLKIPADERANRMPSEDVSTCIERVIKGFVSERTTIENMK
jgi:hypothetical protein